MATKLTTFDFEKPSHLTTSSEDKQAYPWAEWFDGDIWQLTYREDFDPHPLMMERIIRTRAVGRQAKVRVRHMPLNGQAGTNDPTGVIIMERTDIDGPQQQKKSEAAARRKAKKAAASAEATKTLEEMNLAKKAPAKKAPSKLKRLVRVK